MQSRAILNPDNIGSPGKLRDIGAGDDQLLAAGNIVLQPTSLLITQDAYIRQNQGVALKLGQSARGYHLKLQVLLHQQNEDAPIGTNELIRVVIPRLGGEVDSNWMNWDAWQIEGLLVRLNPRENL